jgi:Transmembrane secretion effector
MIAGDTLVTISLAGSLFFSISPTEAKSKVLLYLLLTIAPFAVVSPLLGPAIDRSRNARRAMVVVSAVGRAVLCPFMARDIHSLALFPEAFLVLVFSKVYLVTRGALVPEIATAEGQMASDHSSHAAADQYLTEESVHDGMPRHGLAGWNAQLTLLGTLAGFVFSVPGIILLKTVGSPGVLIFTAFVFIAGAIAGFRLKLPKSNQSHETYDEYGDYYDDAEYYEDDYGEYYDEPVAYEGHRDAARADGWDDDDPDLAAVGPLTHPEVTLGLSANSLLRGIAGFLVFLLAFGLRRSHAALWWYGLALSASGIGALVGLSVVPRLRRWMREPQMITLALALVGLAAVGAAYVDDLWAQVGMAFFVGVAGAIGQPAFDAMTQRYVPVAAQGRAFARFATRQQLIWVIGALIPVAIALPFLGGDVVIAVIAFGGAVLYVIGRVTRVPKNQRARRSR